MHAKIAVADRMVLLVSSANLTSAGIDKNIEAGILVHGGTAPVRVGVRRVLEQDPALARVPAGRGDIIGSTIDTARCAHHRQLWSASQ